MGLRESKVGSVQYTKPKSNIQYTSTIISLVEKHGNTPISRMHAQQRIDIQFKKLNSTSKHCTQLQTGFYFRKIIISDATKGNLELFIRKIMYKPKQLTINFV